MSNGLIAHLFEATWSVLWIVWFIGIFGMKRTVKSHSFFNRILYTSLTFAGFYILFGRTHPFRLLHEQFFPQSDTIAWIGLVLTIAGVGFAIWARICLGRNWSGTVTIKEDHQLVRSGPYQYVRHPIYTGFLLAVTGTALALGSMTGVLAFVFVLTAFIFKARLEEQFMIEQFGDQYLQYRSEVKMLVPFVL